MDNSSKIIEDLQQELVTLRTQKDNLEKEIEQSLEFKMPFELQEQELKQVLIEKFPQSLV